MVIFSTCYYSFTISFLVVKVVNRGRQTHRLVLIQVMFLGEIKCNKCCGPDDIMTNTLKFSAPSIGVQLTKVLNLCISTSTWPAEWKLSHVTPEFTKDDGTSVSNYRPINVLSYPSHI